VDGAALTSVAPLRTLAAPRMRLEGLLLATLASLGCSAATRAQRPSPTTVVTDAATDAGLRSATIELGHWMPEAMSSPRVIDATAERALIIDQSLRATVTADGAVEVARERPQHAIMTWFALIDGRWVFVTDDGLVLSARSFLGPFETRAELPREPSRDRESSGSVYAAAIRLGDDSWWSLEDPARPRRFDEPWMSETYALRILDDRRALALREPGHVLLSDGDRWSQLEMVDDVPLSLVSRGEGRFSVEGLRHTWAIDARGRLGHVVANGAPLEQRRDEEADARWTAPWRRFREAQLARYRGTSSLDLQYGVAHRGAIAVAVGDRLLVLRGDGSTQTIPAHVGFTSEWFAFGRDLLALSDGSLERVDLDANTSTRFSLELAGTNNGSFLLPRWNNHFATDGSAIVSLGVRERTLRVWTPGHAWRELSMPFHCTINDVEEATIYGSNADGLYALSIDSTDALSPRTIARFDRDGGARTYTRALASRAQDGLRAWLLADDEAIRCAVLLEDAEGASTIELPRCRALDSVRFVDRRFGVVAGPSEFRVTRDGRTWTTYDRVIDFLGLRVGGALITRRSYEPFVSEGAIIVAPRHRVTRSAEQSDAIVSRAAPIVTRTDEDRSFEPGYEIACESSGQRDTGPIATDAVVLDALGARVEVRDDPAHRRARLRWTLGATRGDWTGAVPWSTADESATTMRRWTALGVAPHGVVVERCSYNAYHGPTTPTESRCDALWLRAGVEAPTLIALRNPRAEDVDASVVLCEPWERGWVVELVRTSYARGHAVHQWQRIDERGAMRAWRDALRPAVGDRAFSSVSTEWAIAVGEQRDWNVVPTERGDELEVELPREVRVCTGRETPDEPRLVLDKAPIANLRFGESIAGDVTNEPRWHLRQRGDRWCIAAITSAPSARNEHDRRAYGTWTLRADERGTLRGSLYTVDRGRRSAVSQLRCATRPSE
jgi:hypothetical protein